MNELRLAEQGPAVCIETHGCSFNLSDGEVMAGLLARAGCRLVETADRAELVILNTCTVKGRTFLEFEKRFEQLKTAAGRGGPRLVVAGCIPKASESSEFLRGVPAFGPDTIDRVVEVVGAALEDRPLQILHAEDRTGHARRRPALPVQRRNPAVEILPIAAGCLGACSYCQTRLARGALVSFPADDVLDQARRALREGVVELWVTAQDTGAYGRDIGDSLVRLLRRLCALDGDFRIRLGMTNPLWVWRDIDAFLDVLEHPKMFKFLHLPVQSGSDRVLRDMQRPYTVGQFETAGRAFRRRFPDGGLVTDIIVGYPTEEESDFQASLDLLERVAPAAVNRSKFTARPGTPAARLAPLHASVLARRSLALNRIVRRLAGRYHRRWIGRADRVLVDDAPREGTSLAHNDAYRLVVLPGRWPLGRWVEVQYTAATDFHLCAHPAAVPCERRRGDGGGPLH